jgi:hypothetical protein
MAGNKREIKPTDSYQTRSFKLNAQWLKNATKSIGSNAAEVLSDVTPSLYSAASTSADIVRSIKGSSATSKNVKKLIDNNTYVKNARKAISNAFKDLSTGNFNNTDRFGDVDDGKSHTYMSDFDDGAEGEGSNQTVINFNPEGLNSINSSINNQTKAQLQAAKANADIVVATSSAMMTMNQKNAEATLNMLSNINNGIQALVKYNNDTMTNFIQSSMGFYDAIGKAYTSNKNDKKNDEDKRLGFKDILDANGNLKGKDLVKLLGQNTKDAFNTSMVGTLKTMLDTGMDNIVSNPLNVISTVLMKKILPEKIEKSMKSLDKTFASFTTEMLLKASDYFDNLDDGPLAQFGGFLGKSLNIGTDRKSKFKTGGKVTKDAAVFDGITQHAITTEIPKYLRESTSYLRQLVALNGGDPDKALKNSEIFNRETGTFDKYGEYMKDMMGSINESIINTFNDSELGKNLTKVLNSNVIGNNDKESFQELINKFYLAMEKDDRKVLDINRGKDISDIIDGIAGNSKLKDILEESVYSAIDLGEGNLGVNSIRHKARSSRNDRIEELETNNLSDLSTFVKNGNTIDDAIAAVLYGDDGRATQAQNVNPNSVMGHLKSIEDLLYRGINVKVVKDFGDTNGIFDLFGSRRNNSTQTTDSTTPQSNDSDSKLDESAIKDVLAAEESNGSNDGNTSRFIQDNSKRLKNMMHFMITGNTGLAYKEMGGMFGSTISNLGSKLNNSVLEPLKKKIFGDKKEDENGEKEESIFEGVKRVFNNVKKETHDFIFGSKEEGNEKEGIVQKGASLFKEGFEGWKLAIFGSDDEAQKFKEKAQKTLKDRAKSTGMGAVAGAGLGVTMGGVLGNLVGGPLAGAVLGAATGFISKSSKFQEIVFGRESDGQGGFKDGEDENAGIINKKTREFFKNNKTDFIGGGVVGAGLGALTGGGLLGTLVGGPVAGALMGTAVQMVRKSSAFQDMWLGKEDEEGKRSGGMKERLMKAFAGSDAGKEAKSSAKLFGMSAVGSGAGILASFFTPLGPIGGAALGLGASMLAQKEGFHKWLFGDEDKEKGEPGLLKKMGNIIDTHVIMPLADTAKDFMDSAKDAIIDKIVDPLENLLGPLAGLAESIRDSVSDFMEGIKERAKNLFKTITDNAVDALSNVTSKVMDFMKGTIFGKIAGKILGAPGAAMNAIGNKIRKGNEKRSLKRVKGKWKNSNAGKEFYADVDSSWANMSDEEKSQYDDYDDYFNSRAKTKFYYSEDRRGEQAKDRKSRKETREARRQERADITNQKKLIARLTGGATTDITDETKQAALNNFKDSKYYVKNKKLLGMSNEEVMRLLSPKKDEDAAKTQEETLNNAEEQLTAAKESATSLNSIDTKVTEVISYLNQRIFGKDENEPEKEYSNHDQKLIDRADKRNASAEANKKFEEGYNAEKEKKDAERAQNAIDRQKAVEHGFMSEEEAAEEQAAEDEDAARENHQGFKLGKFRRAGLFVKSIFSRNKSVRDSASAVRNMLKSGDASGYDLENAYNAYRDTKKAVKKEKKDSRFAKAFQRRNLAESVKNFVKAGGRAFAEGGETEEPGVVAVGEEGPELVRVKGNEEIIPNDKAIKVQVVAIDDDVTKKLNEEKKDNAIVDVNIVGQNGLLATYGTKATLDENTDNKAQIEKDLSKKDSLVSYDNVKADNDDDNETEEKEEKQSFFSKILSLFGSSGGSGLLGILGKVAVAGAGIYAFFKSETLQNILKSLLSLGGKLLTSLGTTIGDVATDTVENVKWTSENNAYENGADFSTNLSNQAQRATALASGDIGTALLGTDGEADGITSAGLKVGRNIVQKVATGNTGMVRGAASQVKLAKNLISGKGLAESVTDAASGLKGISGAVANMTKSAAEDGAKSVVKDAAKEGSEGILKKVLEKITEVLKSIGETIANKVKGKAADIIKPALKVVEEALDKITKGLYGKFKDLIVKGINKIRNLLTGTAAVASTGVGLIGIVVQKGAFVTLGALNASGKAGAAHLFKCQQEDVDWKMRLIAAAWGGFSQTTPGSIIDIVNEIFAAITGENLICSLASSLYKQISDDDDDAKLEESQAALKEDYQQYQENAYQESYAQYLEDNGLDESQLSYEDYKNGVSSGEIEADIMGFDEYNDKTNQTVGAKLMNGAVNVAKTVGGGIKKVGGAVVTGVKTVGKGVVSGVKAVGKGAATIAKTVGGGVKAAASFVGKGIKSIGSGIGNTMSSAKEALVALNTGRKKIEEEFTNEDGDLSSYMKLDANTLSEDHPFYGLVNTMLGITKIVTIPKMVLTGVLKKIGKSVVSNVKTLIGGVKTLFSAGVDSTVKLQQISKTGDLSALHEFEPEIDDESPMAGVVRGIIGFEKMLYYIPTGVSFVGKKIKDGVVSMLGGVKKIFSTNVNNAAELSKIAVKGDLSGLHEYEPKVDEDVPLAGIVKAVSGFQKMLFYIPAGISFVGHKIADGVVSIVKNIKTDFTNNVKNTTELTKMAVKGDVSGIHSFEPEVNEDSPLSGIMRGLNNVDKIFFYIPAGISFVGHKIADGIKGIVDGVKKVMKTGIDNTSELMKISRTGDFSALGQFEPKVDDDVPLAGVVRGLVGIQKIFYYIPTAFSFVGKKIHAGITSIVDGVKKVMKTGIDNTSELMKISRTGDFSALSAFEPQVDDDVPLAGVVKGLVGIEKMIYYIPTGLSFVGKKIHDGISSMIGGIKKMMSSSLENTSQLKEISKTGDLKALGSFEPQVDDDVPLAGVVKGLVGIEKMIYYIPAGISFVGKKVHDGITSAVNGIKKMMSSSLDNISQLKEISKTGDLTALGQFEPQVDDDVPLAGVVKGLVGIEKMIYYIPTGLSFVGKKIHDGITSAVNGLKKIMTTSLDNTTQLKEISKTGDFSALNNFEADVDDDVPLAGAVRAMVGVEKIFYYIPTAFHFVGNKVSDAFHSFVDGIPKMFKTLKNSMADLNDIAKEGDMEALGKYEMEIDEDTPMSGLIGGIGSIAKILYYIPTTISYVANKIKEKLGFLGNSLFKILKKVAIGDNDDLDDDEEDTESGSGGKGGYGGVPFYSQKDPKWKNMSYDKGGSGDTMGTAGCGPTAFAMAASGATGANINPVQSAAVMKKVGARDDTGTNWSGIGKAANAYGISSRMSTSPSTGFVDSEIASGNPVILSGRSGGYGDTPYTPQGHYVVVTGKDTEGNYIVNDPNKKSGASKYNKSAIMKETGAAWGIGGKGRSLRGGRGFRGRGGRGTESTVGNVYLDDMYSDTEDESYATYTEGKKRATHTAWMKIVKAVKRAIAAQSPGYNQSNWIDITIANKTLKVRTDCSGFVGACLKYFGVLDDNTNTTSYMYANANSGVIKNTGFTPYAWSGWDSLTEGDIIGRDGHVEIFAYNENGKHYVYNCGSNASVNNPSSTPAAYSAYTTYWRHMDDLPANAINTSMIELDDSKAGTTTSGTVGSAVDSSGDATTDSSSSSSSTSGGFLSNITTFLSELGTRAINGISTGEWNTDWSGVFDGSDSSSSDDATTSTDDSSSTDSSTSASSYSSTADPSIVNNDIALKGWRYFTNNGYSKAATAAILGNLQQESNIDPTAIQGKGKGPAAGIAQWEDYNTKSGRWLDLKNYADSKNKDWTDAQTQFEFIDKELQGRTNRFENDYPFDKNDPSKGTTLGNAGATTTTFEDWKKSTDVDMATRQFEGAFEVAGKPIMENRIKYANGYYKTYGNGLSSGNISTVGVVGLDDMYSATDEELSAGKGGKGGYGGFGEAISEESSMSRSVNTLANSTSSDFNNTSDVLNNSDVVKYLSQIVTILTESNGKLDGLKDIKNLSGTTNVYQSNTTNNNNLEKSTGTSSASKTDVSKRLLHQKIAADGI